MTPTAVSVIVVSRGRPDALTRCLKGLEQLDHDNFEIVVVADPAGQLALRDSGVEPLIKSVSFDEANISRARNLGLQAAAGDIVAFIDDDAVPEPTWLTYLSAPFQSPVVAATGGYVRGRNGISFQNTARGVDGTGRHKDLPVTGDSSVILAGKPGQAIKTEGTNCAFRRETLAGMGGFDPAFPFYMDETDLNLRLARDGHSTAIVPLAQVHHGFAASDRRYASRMPRSLFDIGASQMVLLRKHAPDADPTPVLRDVRVEQRARLVRHMVAGNCEPRDIAALLTTLGAGIAAGRTRDIRPLPPLGASKTAFFQFIPQTRFRGHAALAGRPWQGRRLRRKSGDLIASGQRVSLFLFSATTLFHRVVFTRNGVWEQRGGLWGKSDRNDKAVAFWGLSARVKREVGRLHTVRICGEII